MKTHDDKIRINVLTKFHEDPPASPPAFANLITSFFLRKTWLKTAPHPGGNVFQPTRTILELHQYIIKANTINVTYTRVLKKDITGTNILTRFHNDQTIHVNKENGPPPDGNVFQKTTSIFELIQDIIGTNFLTKLHEDWTINEKCPIPGGHIFPPTGTIFEHIQVIIGTNLLTKKYAPPSGGHVFQPTGNILKLFQYLIGTNLLTKFHDDRTINVASIEKNTPSLAAMFFQPTKTIFKLIHDNIGTNLVTKLHEDLTLNVAYTVLTRQILMTHARRLRTDK
ncbi:hypothetical protein DPMN_035596 [Dreissena polymorpha]|uniref:Uncharacterized protein n=1 Tax=Dreissena polymorpha TaxID=45954 RepID=A0A9D4M9W6_DREPO|nr:hypothetical protein DPMN_035596 [Dreissena polymorpha]